MKSAKRYVEMIEAELGVGRLVLSAEAKRGVERVLRELAQEVFDNAYVDEAGDVDGGLDLINDWGVRA